jgi:alkanesulfonate monooxygenase SsuD/methylene tetrahydromethanopterin reductase-like flavin-dependent oxidoreductase (luciferase family)
MAPIDFGWTMPTGQKRLPIGQGDYTDHVKKILELIHGRFHSAWMPDHFMDGLLPVPEALLTLSYFAGLFPELHWGTAVLGQSYRNPALLAKMVATMQQLTAGQFIMGIGAGWKEEEYLAYGYPFPRAGVRIAQMVEVIQICRALWDPTIDQATFTGHYHQIRDAVCRPKPSPSPPIMIGGGGEKLTLRAVAEHADWWNLPGASPAGFKQKKEVLSAHCTEIGRDIASIRMSWMGVVSIAGSQEKAEEQLADYPIWPGDIPLLGTPTMIRDQLLAYIDCGIDLFILSFVDEPGTRGIQLFLDDVLPKLN